MNYLCKALFILFFMLCNFVYSQTISELESRFKKADKKEKVLIANTLAESYLSQRKLDKCIEWAEDGLKAAKKARVDNSIIASLNKCLGSAYAYKKDHKKALKYYEEEYNILTKMKLETTSMTSAFNIGIMAHEQKNYKMAITYYEKSLKLAKKYGNGNVLINGYMGLADIYKKQSDYKNAMDAYEKLLHYKKVATNFKLGIMEEKYKATVEQKEKEIQEKQIDIEELSADTLEKANEIDNLEIEKEKQDLLLKLQQIEVENQKRIADQAKRDLWKAIGFIAIVIILLFFVIRQFIANLKAYKKISLQNIEIQKQHDEISNQRDKIVKQNKDITDSIRYASRIQSALLPPADYLTKILPDHFIFFRPRNIVSGDFYWVTRKMNKIIFVAADCTGHGVPGAMMSMLGMSFLKEIVNKETESDHADIILNQLRDNVVISLRQLDANSESKDGMDISLCIIDQKTLKMQFAGAHNPALVVRKNTETGTFECIEIKADKMPIGFSKEFSPFTKKDFDLRKGDTVYLFSDGYVDQFGGDKGRKFMRKHFEALVLTLQEHPLSKQKEILEQTYDEWRSKPGRELNNPYPQLDDVLVTGFKV